MTATPLLTADGYQSKKIFPTFRNPTIVGEFSVNRQRQVELGRSQLRYFYANVLRSRNLGFDLSSGFDVFESKDELLEPEGLDVLCKWLLIKAAKDNCLSLKEVCCNADFVCFRGLLTRIASSPFDKSDGWMASAVRIGSTIFMCEFQNERKERRLATLTERDKLLSYWGFKFEQYVTTANQNEKPVTNEPVNNLSEFDVAVKTTLGEEDAVRLLFVGETDCIDSNGRYLELKTQGKQLSPYFWSSKAMKWWIQSFLIGIKEIMVGYRNNKGIVNRVSRFPVSNLYRNTTTWSPAATFQFLLDTLRLMRQKLNAQKDMEYILFEYNPDDSQVTYKVLGNDANSKYCFMPDDFVSHFKAAQA